VTDGVIVRFDGAGAGIADLSWGQQEMWSVMQVKGSSLPFGSVRALPKGEAVADVAAGLRFIMGRHQSLRTTLRFDPGGHVHQVVHACGEITLDVADAGDDNPGDVAAAIAAGYKARNFDYEHEWPLRMCVITHRGAATHVVKVVCHIAADAFGLAALDDDFDRRHERTGPVTALQPAEQARWQRGPGGVRAHEASMRYFERLAANVSGPQFSESADPRTPRFWQAILESPAGYRASRMLAARLGLSTSPVLLAAFAMALGPLTRGGQVAVEVVVNNRFRPGVADSVSTVAQTCLCVIDTAGVPFEDVVARAWRSALGAYKHAYYDPAGKAGVRRRIAAERGRTLDPDVLFNDRRVRSRQLADAADEVEDVWLPLLRDELSRTTLTWGERNDSPEEKVSLNLCDMPGTLCCDLWADTHFVSPADMAGLLRRIESVLVDAALDLTERPDQESREVGT